MWLAWLFRGKPLPPSGFNDQYLPDSDFSILKELTYGWIWPLLKVGYTRPLVEEDLWRIDPARGAAACGKRIGEAFYERCPPELRPGYRRSNAAPTIDKEDKSSSSSGFKVDDAADGDTEKTAGQAVGRGDGLESIAEDPLAENNADHAPSIKDSPPSSWSANQRRPSLAIRLAADATTTDPGASDDLDREESREADETLRRIETNAKNRAQEEDIHFAAFVDPGMGGTTGSKNYDQSLFRALLWTFRYRVATAYVLYAISMALRIGSAFVTKLLVSYISRSHDYLNASEQQRDALSRPEGVAYGFGLAIALSAMLAISVVVKTAGFKIGGDIGCLVRSGLSTLICRKSMVLSARARFILTDGRMINSLAADTNTMLASMLSFVGVFAAPLEITTGFVALVILLGPIAFVGIGCILLLMPPSWWALQRFQKSARQHLGWADKRINVTSEILGNIRAVKIHAYETYFQDQVSDLRQRELVKLRANVWEKAALKSFMNFSPILAAVITFIAYAYTGHELDTATIFAALQLFRFISDPINDLSYDSVDLLNSVVASRRVRDILVGEELQNIKRYVPLHTFALSINGIFEYDSECKADGPSGPEEERNLKQRLFKRSIRRRPVASAKSNQDEPASGPFRLELRHIDVQRGDLICVIGKIGAGKTTLIQAILGELRMLRGQVVHGGTSSYVAQRPWIQSGSIREQILFGSAEDPVRLQQTVAACALNVDLEELVDGLDTEIGERGITLSGGQKARLALARAAYANRDIVLLDDPLSAVDAHVARHLIHACLLGSMGHLTRVLVTHNLGILPFATEILVVENGKIVQRGSFAQLKAQSGWLQEVLTEQGQRVVEEDASITGGKLSASETETVLDAVDEKKGIPARRLIEDEERLTGSVQGEHYVRYAKLMGGPVVLLALAVAIVMQEASTIGTSVILGFWSGSAIRGFTQGRYIAVYGSLAVIQILSIAYSVYAFGLAALKASKALFATAFQRIMSSPIAWWDRTPTGRISSRLSKDVADTDTQIANALLSLISKVASLAGTLGLILWIYSLLGVIFVPLTLIFLFVANLYRPTAREIKRLDSNIRSHTYNAFAEQLGGLTTIRAFQHEDQIARQMVNAVDRQQSAQYLSLVLRRWLALRLNTLTCVLVFAIACFGVGFRKTASPAKFGVVLTYSISIMFSLTIIIRFWAMVEQSMNSVERLNHYRDLPLEEANTEHDHAPSGWPSLGHIHFQDVRLRYRDDLPLVLKGLTFEAQAGEKVGIVGRTGAGKSTVAQALFRLVEICGGKILVDGVDVQRLDLVTARSSLSCIPQESLLFKGKIRDNLDPQGLRSDAEMNEALGRCGLKPAEGASEDDRRRFAKFQLDAEVALDGNDFSAGERQLVALARAVLKGSKLILLDEATSSVDAETDAQFQRTIRKELTGTVITIAHRLVSIAFYDKVLVLDEGRAAEFGPPLELFDKPDSIFRGLCDAARLTREQIVQIRLAA